MRIVFSGAGIILHLQLFISELRRRCSGAHWRHLAAAVLTIQMTRTHWLERCKQFSLSSFFMSLHDWCPGSSAKLFTFHHVSLPRLICILIICSMFNFSWSKVTWEARFFLYLNFSIFSWIFLNRNYYFFNLNERCKQFSLVSSCQFTIDAREALQNYLCFIMFPFPDSYV